MGPRWWTLGPAQHVEDRLFKALAVLRAVVTVNMVGLNLWRAENFVHPAAAITAVLGLVGWSVVVTWAYASRERRRPAWFIADLLIALAGLAVTIYLKGPDFNASLPGYWAMTPIMAWAVHWRWQGGLFAGTWVASVDLAIRSDIDQTNYGNAFLLLIAGPIVGYMCAELQRSAVERDAAERTAAVAAERARLARAVHDGVLQVLALVQRKGAELGGEFAELGRMAGDQESALRTLIRQQDLVGPEGVGDERDTDLAVALEALASAGGPPIEVVTPGAPVWCRPQVAEEIVAAVTECVANVVRHVGQDAPSWVLLEELEDRVVVTVRDEGGGIPDGRLAAAAAEGRLGVAGSIVERIRDLGGETALSTGTFGTEWELSVPTRKTGP